MGVKMTLRQEIEHIRQMHNASVVEMCNVLLLASEQEYWEFIHGHHSLSAIQLIGVMEVFHVPLESM